jgi:hypothetical protein
VYLEEHLEAWAINTTGVITIRGNTNSTITVLNAGGASCSVAFKIRYKA